MKLRDFSSFLSSTFIYELILTKKSMNANIKKTQIFHKIKVWPQRSLLIKGPLITT